MGATLIASRAASAGKSGLDRGDLEQPVDTLSSKQAGRSGTYDAGSGFRSAPARPGSAQGGCNGKRERVDRANAITD